jgi:AbiU2
MASKEVVAMPAVDLYTRWQGHVKRIYTETVYIFTTRYKFREIQDMFRKNKELNKIGGDVYEWLLGIWGRDVLMAIRRELDTQSGTINLVHLLREIQDRPDVLTRRRWLARSSSRKTGNSCRSL